MRRNIANLNYSAVLPPIIHTIAFVLVLSEAVLLLLGSFQVAARLNNQESRFEES